MSQYVYYMCAGLKCWQSVITRPVGGLKTSTRKGEGVITKRLLNLLQLNTTYAISSVLEVYLFISQI